MNRSDLGYEISRRTGLAPGHVLTTLDAFTDILRECATDGIKVQIAGVFSQETVTRAGRTGRNPRTGEPIEIPAQPTVKLTAGSSLKAAAKAHR